MPFRSFVVVLASVALMGSLAPSAFPQRFSGTDRELAQVILQTVASDVRKYYYDPKLHGLDWDKKVNETRDRVAQANSFDTAVLEIAALLELLNDSHTFYDPPADPIAQEYGWRFQMVGDRCFITEVQPKSDAAQKGLKPGDEVLTIDGFRPTRAALAKIEYVLYTLVPQSAVKMDVWTLEGDVKHLTVKPRIRQRTAVTDLNDVTGRDKWRLRLEQEDEIRLLRPRFKEFGEEALVVKLPVFAMTDTTLDEIVGKARKHRTLIFDLRGNPGGAENNLQDLLGAMFENDVKIADRITRDSKQVLSAKAAHKPFTGKLIELVDNRSASAAELFSKVAQLEKRGVVIGDQTAGSVMEAKHYSHRAGTNPIFFYGDSVSEADLIMTDGKSLEHVGVTPDELLLPSASDIANRRDPVLARAIKLAGVELSLEQAGALFPFEWPKW